MQRLVSSICEVLTTEAAVHEELCLLSESKKEAITKNDIPALEAIVKQEQTFLTRIQDCERRRRAVVLSMAGQLSRPAEEVKLQDFLDVATPEAREDIQNLSNKLGDLLKKQKELNELNRKLIESRLEFIDYTLSTVTQRDNPSQIYGGRGAPAGTDHGLKISLIDRKV